MPISPLRAVPALVAALTLVTAAHAKNLTIGDPAPPLKVGGWVKGKPVTFEKGKVYVVEFWATWCGPCRTSIPHLTELAKKYAGKVSFTGVSVWEENAGKMTPAETRAKVAKFVETMGPKMAYNVALDSTDKAMATNWMTAAGENGIPSAFVVGKDGKIAWVGHPMGDLDSVLQQVVAGTYDVAAAAAKREKEKAGEERLVALQRKIGALVQGQKYAEAVAELDKVIAEDPSSADQFEGAKFNLLLRFDLPGAAAQAQKLAAGPFKDNALALNSFAWQLVDTENPQLEAALPIAERAVELSQSKNAMILDTLGFVQFKAGKIDDAIATQSKAVALLASDKAIDDKTKKEITDRLAEFKKAKP
jgi:thiol-disulfide isomerase/thioredoxin/Tfp pilus assembly protein PilF